MIDEEKTDLVAIYIAACLPKPANRAPLSFHTVAGNWAGRLYWRGFSPST